MIFNKSRLINLRKERGLSMEDVAKITGIAQSSLSQIETGKTENPRITTLEKLCRGLGVNELYFYISGENTAEIFPSNMDAETRGFCLDAENLPYILLAKKMKQSGTNIAKIEGLMTFLDASN